LCLLWYGFSSCMVWLTFPYPYLLFRMCSDYTEIGLFVLMCLVCLRCRICVDFQFVKHMIYNTFEILIYICR
jgi:hypothetical protein